MTTTPRRAADRAALRHQITTEAPALKQARVLGPEELAQMLSIACPRDRALVALLTAAAGRIGETTLLQWGDLAGDQLLIPAAITKTKHSRTVALPIAALQYLDAWRKLCPRTEAGWIFPGRPIRHPLSVRGAQKRISALAERLGLEGVSSHSFRRSAVTAAHKAGLPWAVVAAVSGHKDRRSLERYIEASACREAADLARELLFARSVQGWQAPGAAVTNPWSPARKEPVAIEHD